MKLLKRKLKLATTQEEFDIQADKFLSEHGFELNDEMRALYGTFVQHSSDKQDWIDPDLVAQQIRKALAIRCAFYLIQPGRRPKKDEQVVEAVTEPVVSKAQ